jgi:hypothetical protein
MLADTLRAAVATGDEVSLSGTVSHGESQRDDSVAESTGRVPADLIFELVTGRDSASTGQPRTLKLSGARITGELRLDWTQALCPIVLSSCYFEKGLTAVHARMPALHLHACHVPALDLTSLSADMVDLTASTFIDPVIIQDMRMAGPLVMNRAILASSKGPSLVANGVRVDRDWICIDLKAQGNLELMDVIVGGSLSLISSDPAGPDDNAAGIFADRLQVRGTLFLNGIKTSGNVSLMGADVGGNIEMDGAHLRQGMLAAGTQVGGNVNLRSGFSSEEGVSLDGCKLSGCLDIHNADLGTDVDGYSLSAEGLQAMSVMARGLKAKGIIDLLGAHIAGSLEMDGASLEEDDSASLVADQATVGGSVKIGEGFKAPGRVRFLGAKINGQLDIANNSSIASLMLADASAQTLIDGNEASWPKELI